MEFARWAVSVIFWKITFCDFTAFFLFFDTSKPLFFQTFLIRSIQAYLCQNIINFDVDGFWYKNKASLWRSDIKVSFDFQYTFQEIKFHKIDDIWQIHSFFKYLQNTGCNASSQSLDICAAKLLGYAGILTVHHKLYSEKHLYFIDLKKKEIIFLSIYSIYIAQIIVMQKMPICKLLYQPST